MSKASSNNVDFGSSLSLTQVWVKKNFNFYNEEQTPPPHIEFLDSFKILCLWMLILFAFYKIEAFLIHFFLHKVPGIPRS